MLSLRGGECTGARLQLTTTIHKATATIEQSYLTDTITIQLFLNRFLFFIFNFSMAIQRTHELLWIKNGHEKIRRIKCNTTNESDKSEIKAKNIVRSAFFSYPFFLFLTIQMAQRFWPININDHDHSNWIVACQLSSTRSYSALWLNGR